MGQDPIQQIVHTLNTFLTRIAGPGINRPFAYCKGGNFNIHIWALFG